MKDLSQWNKTKQWIKKKDPKFEIKTKQDNKFHMFIDKLLFFTHYSTAYTMLLHTLWKPRHSFNYKVLQHEAVHNIDQRTFFGLMPWMSEVVNYVLFLLVYLFPHWLVLFSVFSFWNPLWLLCLLFLLPLPSPGMALAELRAYRRSRELGRDIESIVDNFVNTDYYFMFPFRKWMTKIIMKPSPYKKEMDKIV